MTKQIIIAAFFLAASTNLFAQPEGDKREKLESLKIAFLTNKLDLSSDEAKVFWPVYNDYQEEMHTVRKETRQDMNDTRSNFDSMTDDEVNAMMDRMIEHKQKEVDILKKYKVEFGEVLPAKKVAIFFKSEREFKKKLLDILGEGRGQGPPKGGGRGRGPRAF